MGVVAVVGLALGAVAVVFVVLVELVAVLDFELPQPAAANRSASATGTTIVRFGGFLIPAVV
jgi:hypothetical protein